MCFKSKKELKIRWCLIRSASCAGFLADFTFPTTNRVSDVREHLILGLSKLNPNHSFQDLKSLYFPRLHKFLTPKELILKESVRENDLIVLTDIEDIKDAKAIEAVIYLRGYLVNDKSTENNRLKLVMRELTRAIPHIGKALDALIFGNK